MGFLGFVGVGWMICQEILCIEKEEERFAFFGDEGFGAARIEMDIPPRTLLDKKRAKHTA